MIRFFTILFICLPFLLNAQSINRSEIIGTWTAIDGAITSTDLPVDLKEIMTMMIEGFKESIWTFDENGMFRIQFSKYLSPQMKEMKFLDNKLWEFNGTINQIRIGTKEDNYNHLVLSAKQVNSGLNVYFSDTPVYLTLRKQ